MIEVIRPGQFTTIQDLGRFAYRAMGVPVSGPMDRASAAFANQLLGNESNASVIEMSFTGASFIFHQPAIIAIAGANCTIQVDLEVIQTNRVVKVNANSTVSFGAISSGNFVYLAILGGFRSEIVLGSSCYFGGLTQDARMKKGTEIGFETSIQTYKSHGVSVKPIPHQINTHIQVEKGPEFHLLSDADLQLLTESNFAISPQSNRMGFRLEDRVSINGTEIISSPVQPGTVQLTPGGQLLVLMRDAQTTGGYSRIFQITPSSLNQLAQKRFGERFKFQIID